MRAACPAVTPLISAALLLASCSAPPTASVPLASVEEARALRSSIGKFAAMTPELFTLVSALDIDSSGHGGSPLIGVVSVDGPARSFTITAMNPLGAKAFEVGYSGGRVERSLALPSLEVRDGFAEAVAQDILLSYFDLMPSGAAEAASREHGTVFRERAGNDIYERTFDAGGFLVSKRKYEQGALAWEAGYTGYLIEDGKAFARVLEIENHRMGYRLKVRLKEIARND